MVCGEHISASEGSARLDFSGFLLFYFLMCFLQTRQSRRHNKITTAQPRYLSSPEFVCFRFGSHHFGRIITFFLGEQKITNNDHTQNSHTLTHRVQSAHVARVGCICIFKCETARAAVPCTSTSQHVCRLCIVSFNNLQICVTISGNEAHIMLDLIMRGKTHIYKVFPFICAF